MFDIFTIKRKLLIYWCLFLKPWTMLSMYSYSLQFLLASHVIGKYLFVNKYFSLKYLCSP